MPYPVSRVCIRIHVEEGILNSCFTSIGAFRDNRERIGRTGLILGFERYVLCTHWLEEMFLRCFGASSGSCGMLFSLLSMRLKDSGIAWARTRLFLGLGFRVYFEIRRLVGTV